MRSLDLSVRIIDPNYFSYKRRQLVTLSEVLSLSGKVTTGNTAMTLLLVGLGYFWYRKYFRKVKRNG